jgi:hypothetical protein
VRIGVAAAVEAVEDGVKVHGVLDDGVVVAEAKDARVHRLREHPPVVVPKQLVQERTAAPERAEEIAAVRDYSRSRRRCRCRSWSWSWSRNRSLRPRPLGVAVRRGEARRRELSARHQRVFGRLQALRGNSAASQPYSRSFPRLCKWEPARTGLGAIKTGLEIKLARSGPGLVQTISPGFVCAVFQNCASVQRNLV